MNTCNILLYPLPKMAPPPSARRMKPSAPTTAAVRFGTDVEVVADLSTVDGRGLVGWTCMAASMRSASAIARESTVCASVSCCAGSAAAHSGHEAYPLSQCPASAAYAAAVAAWELVASECAKRRANTTTSAEARSAPMPGAPMSSNCSIKFERRASVCVPWSSPTGGKLLHECSRWDEVVHTAMLASHSHNRAERSRSMTKYRCSHGVVAVAVTDAAE